ncbi:MAG: 5-demethoxyubiquinol-8 5-hydroxylase UbiM [Rickettsiales bacterium]|nr:5-demethoxyubiquinol-8 5-hydroxylase UbiM [Rickettsiales bacterium]
MQMQDVIIIGGGPAGLSFACSLSALGLNCTIIEKQTEAELADPSYDGREIALTHFSRHLLQQMGVWQRFPEDAVGMIREAKVLDGTSPYTLHFDYREVCDDTLGYIASNHQIRKVLYEEVKSRGNIALLCEKSVESIETGENTATVFLSSGQQYSAPLVVAADSRFSGSRRHMGISTSMRDFGKVAIVCKVSHELPHDDTAYECFRYGGTLAVLPLPGNESSIVITVSPEKAQFLMTQDTDHFSTDVTAQFDQRFGAMRLSGERFSYPLVATYADRFFARRFAVIGDAAVGMHPVTAHGFNLGLKGQHLLAMQIKQAVERRVDIGSSSVLSGYGIKHRRASKPLYLATNFIVGLYTDERPLHKLARKAVLRLGNRILPAKKAIMHQLTEIREVA